MEESKRIDLEEEMLDYIFRSRSEENDFLEEAIMGRRALTAYERALEEGREEGELRGELKKAIETARKMLEEEDSIEKIIRITGLSEDQLKENGIL
jgi:predicted transposase/invertase (TIGR01784 family)